MLGRTGWLGYQLSTLLLGLCNGFGQDFPRFFDAIFDVEWRLDGRLRSPPALALGLFWLRSNRHLL